VLLLLNFNFSKDLDALIATVLVVIHLDGSSGVPVRGGAAWTSCRSLMAFGSIDALQTDFVLNLFRVEDHDGIAVRDAQPVR
jgi:hypothetical protein